MFNLPNPGSNPANPFYYRTQEEQRRALEEAVTVELDFKSDAEGKKAGGKMVRKGVYKMTFKNNAEMNKFMDTHADKLNEEKEMDPAKHVSRSKKNPDMFCVFDKDGEEVKLFKEKSDAIEYAKKNHDALMESTPEYRAMMKRYKGSDMEKVFKILDKEGFRMGEQSDTLVRNMLKKHRGNVKKAADQIMKDNPGMFDVNRMMMDHVEIDEAEVYKRPVKVSALGGQKFHAVVENGKIVAAGMTEKEARKMKKFGQQVRELPGAKVGQLVKEDVEQIDEAYEVTFQFKGSKTKFMSRVKEFQNSGAMTGFSELDKRIEGRPNMVKMTFKSKSDFNKFFSQGVSGGVVKVQENVELDEMSAKQHYNKMVAQGKVGRGGRLVTPIDRKRFPNREKEGLEGPFRSRKSGQVYYYDKKAGKYYDPLSDMFLQVKDVMETYVTENVDDYINAHETQVNEEGPNNPLPPDEIWTRILLPQTLRLAQDPSLPYNSGFDWNGDGEHTLADLNIAIQLWQQGLAPMLATQYLQMMSMLDAKRGQRVGPKAPMNPLGTKAGSRPTQPPPPDMSGGAGGK